MSTVAERIEHARSEVIEADEALRGLRSWEPERKLWEQRRSSAARRIAMLTEDQRSLTTTSA